LSARLPKLKLEGGEAPLFDDDWNGLINVTKGGKREGKRRLITLEDVRREFQEELDRRAALKQGRFGFMDAGNEMDVL
jgi:hypothetical protein